MKCSLVGFSCLLLGVLLVAGAVDGQDLAGPSVDRSDGEEWQIKERDRWFSEKRGLEQISRPDLLRERAVEIQRQSSDQRTPSLSWSSLGPESMAMPGWVMGPVSGRISALAVHPTDENVIYLGGASGGLWKTTDGGSTWTPIFDDVGTLTIGSITIEPGSPNRIWVGTGEQGQYCGGYFGLGLFLSTDGGVTFEPKNGSAGSELQLSYVASVVVHPDNPEVVLAGGHGWCDDGSFDAGGLFRSSDGGTTWQKLLDGPVSDVLFDPVEPDVAFAAMGRWGWTNDGIYRSEDGGASWARLQSGLPFGGSVGRIRLAMSDSNHQVLYALVNTSSNSNSRLYKSTDGGASWELKNNNACEGQCSYDLCLDVHPTNPAKVLVGSIRFAESVNSGATLIYKTDGWGTSQKVHQDTHVVRYSRGTPGRYWVGSDGGIWRTDDNGVSFENLNSNLVLTQFYDIEVHPEDDQTVFGGSQDNSSERRVGSQQWEVSVVTGDGFMNAVDVSMPTTVFQTSYPSGGLPSIVKSTAGGAPGSFSWMSTAGISFGPFPWVTSLVLPGVRPDPVGNTPSQLLVASNRIYRGAAAQPASSFSWTAISPNVVGGSGSVSVMTPFADDDKIGLYVGTSNGKVWRTGDIMQATPIAGWIQVTGNYPGGSVSDLATNPSDADDVLLTTSTFGSAQLFRSRDGGGSWQAVGEGLPRVPANSVAVDPIDMRRVFVGTDVGVFVSGTFGETFVPEGNGMPAGLVVTDVEVDASPYVVTVGTYGRGVFQAELSETSGVLFSDDFESGDTSAW